MKQIVQEVDIELSKEETKTLYKAKLIVKELQANLKRIQVLRKPYALDTVDSALEGLHDVLSNYGAWINSDTDEEMHKMEVKYQQLDDEE